ncbi:MAG TPA: glycogen debranching protein GlgX [Gammaproteobacteria bacterium]|nr:glycogen debranching protein GlgX [Gammaproteobacteria bacterium]
MPYTNGARRVRRGEPTPLGATWDGEGTNFALFSAHAEKVELCLFHPTEHHEVERVILPEYTNEVWHGYLPEVGPGTLYGYRVYGPYDPENGHRFNHYKLLLDPYAKMLIGEVKWSEAQFGYQLGSDEKDLSFDERDSAPGMPKCQVIDPSFDWTNDDDQRPKVSWERTIVYETHVRGYTMLHPAVPPELRGNFKGLGQQAVIDYIKSLGITAIELLPIHAFVDDKLLLDKGLKNYWGYNSTGFFAPMQRYLGPDGLPGFKQMVRRFHEAGIQVILDVVYNHTAEGNELGPTLSFKGIDNFSYYRTVPDQHRYYIDDTGTGNTVNTSHPRVLQMVMDSLRYWVEEMHVDGFRFDLGTILGREPHGFDPRGGFFDAVGQDPVLAKVKLIGEPWDLGPGGYQVGGFPPGWAEWNGRYRDTMRSYWKGDEGIMQDFAARVTGSGDMYDRHGRRPWSSINFITAHDGFTLNDLVSYNDKHNEKNGENNQDGHNDNRSWNCGVEGPADDPEIHALREQQKHNFLATLFLSHGTPMMLAGDEFGQTQDGNNNAYCQDNEISWIKWDDIDHDDRALTEFVRQVTALRQSQPLLRRTSYRDGMIIRWINPNGEDQTEEQWQDPGALCIGLLLDGSEIRDSAYEEHEGERMLLVVFNAYHNKLPFKLPAPRGQTRWRRLLDTQTGANNMDDTSHDSGEEIELAGRSLIVLAPSI